MKSHAIFLKNDSILSGARSTINGGMTLMTPKSNTKDLSLTKLAQKIIEQRPKVTKRRLIKSILETGRITN